MTEQPLSLRNLTKKFGGKIAVDDVSFDVKPGEIIGFLGPNGAGKTTTIRMALGLIKQDKGEVSLFGGDPGPRTFGRIAFLPEERGLYKKQTARETIAHMARLNGMKARDAFPLADRLLDKYGLGEAKRKKNKDMSKGMAQKVQLLAAIAHDPEFYVLDEPFSGLDPVNQQVLENMVREIAERGRTIIFSTHVMEHAERLCDRIILMSCGRVVFDGSIEDALAKAPRRLVIQSDDKKINTILEPFATSIEERSDGALTVFLKPEKEAFAIVEKCVKAKIRLTRFEPKNPSLHEAFVTMVGEDEAAKMHAGVFA
ncbi:MAG: ATP-binding cassette domain-containing protein [Hellea sp.]|nr:ATP-binding cassette domain-containing protein [Hellea sp.]